MTYSSTSFYFMEHPRHEPETLGQDGVRTPQSHIHPASNGLSLRHVPFAFG